MSEFSLEKELTLTIRKAEMRDAGQIAVNNRLLAEETEGIRLDETASLNGVKAVLKDGRKGFYLLAESATAAPALAGQLLITFEWSDWRNRMFWWIQSVFVTEKFRRQGVFGSLYHHVAEMAHFQKNVAGLRLYVAFHNQAARAVYEALGMTKTYYEMYEVDFYNAPRKAEAAQH